MRGVVRWPFIEAFSQGLAADIQKGVAALTGPGYGICDGGIKAWRNGLQTKNVARNKPGISRKLIAFHLLSKGLPFTDKRHLKVFSYSSRMVSKSTSQAKWPAFVALRIL